MSYILLYREKERKPKLESQRALMEHQAITAVTRSILASLSSEGMKRSEHRLIAPAHIDLLPLFALIADDYTEFIEPESERPVVSAPIVLYQDLETYKTEDDDQVIRQFLHPRWFDMTEGLLSLQKVIYRYRPEVCVYFGENDFRFSALAEIDYRFRQVIGFSLLMPEGAQDNFATIGEEIIMADQRLDREISRGMRMLEMPYERSEEASYWYSLYRDDEQRPQLEPFVAFGAAFEMVMPGSSGLRTRESNLR